MERGEPPPIVRRTASDLAPDELQAEFTRYGIPSGDQATRLNTLQVKYDEEYDAARLEYEEYLRHQQLKKTKEMYERAVHDMKTLEEQAVVRDPTTQTLIKQIQQDIAPKHLIVRHIAPLACCALLRAMRDNTNVLTLDLSNNALDDVIAEAIGKMLRKNKRLRALNLSGNAFTAASLQSLGTALMQNAVLTSLSLESNPIMALLVPNDAASNSSSSSNAPPLQPFEAFLTALSQTSTLTSLNLFHTQMTVDVGRALNKALEKNTSLAALEIGGNTVRQADLAAMMARITNNQNQMAVSESKAAKIRVDMEHAAEEKRQEQLQHEKELANAAWHEQNARERAERREKEEWERARLQAEEDVRVLLAIEADQKTYMEKMEEKKAKATKGKK
ncbi:hypothetical protein Poli38472_005893 [Pythium oligandrum]|uniref:Uncharacterized protein n=1 Tax=Pythium oligandrum TaxID=41045 RepID=A0A8K1CRX8_PYTOL|nr:hypothetical protein Poli38472_005893 [Pythium oligandrum]|eukprot:TMW68425.1 hypothetical protein Poli38472_005893 [Pythium oligandrum]